MKSKIRLYLLGLKGLVVLSNILEKFDNSIIKEIIIDNDAGVENDYLNDLVELCTRENIKFLFRKEDISHDESLSIAIGWRYIINLTRIPNLIVFHDSLLPRYRGFNPLVSAIINGDRTIGATALYASNQYDTGEIIYQYQVCIDYPIKIIDAINKISEGYVEMIIRIIDQVMNNQPLPKTKQDEKKATYSLWRDESDYIIDWNQSSEVIVRFINAVGFPYKGAITSLNKTKIVIISAEAIKDVVIENRCPGKAIFIQDGSPIIVCGQGLLKINEMKMLDSNEPIGFKSIRTRLT